MSKGHGIESSEESEYQAISERKTNRNSGEVQWNFRRRDASDRSSQPHSAPTGITAQQSENFQRFYRAVVSPTHVRVTAGGRIVPNTRTTAPPQFDWNGDKLHFEPRKPEGELDHHKIHPNSWLQSASHHSGFPPPIPGGFLPSYNLLPRGNSVAMAAMTSQIQPGPLINNNQPPPVNGENATGASAQTAALPQQIKISPPNQFDQTKPFMYNGHLVYPVPPGFQPPPSALPVPISMLGNSSFLPQTPMPPPTGFYPPQVPVSLTSMANQFMFPAGQQLPMSMPNVMQPLENAPSLTPYIPMPPPMASILDIIKSQIQFLQVSLKQINEKIANNKSQIDETFMEHQRGAILSQIGNMQAMLEIQLAQDGGSKSGLQGEEIQGGLGISMTSSQENTVRSTTSSTSTIAQQSNEASVSVGVQIDSAKATAKTDTTPVEQNSGEKPAVRTESATKSRLTMAAAMAPPFQPRAQTAITQASQAQLANEIQRSAMTSPIENVPFETQAQIESRLLARSSTDWGYSGFSNLAATANVTLSRTQSVQEPSTQTQHNRQPPVLQKFNTFHGQTNTARTSPSIISPNAVPYLVGTIPHGIPASQAKSTDLIYSRPLTDDEIRARYLYWGKAPRSVQSGLPKFDGKDFYPPSPIKQDSALASVTPNTSFMGSRTINASVPQLNFEKLFDSPAESPNQNFSEQAAHCGRSSVPNQEAHFENLDHGYEAVSFRFGAAGLSGWSRNYGHAEESTNQPQTPPRAMENQNMALTPITEDFSHLFLERGVPGYKSPSPLRRDMTQSRLKFDKEPVTPKNPGSPDESEPGLDTGRLDSRETTNFESTNTINESNRITTESAENDSSSTTSTVEIHLSPQSNRRSPRPAHKISFAERVENFRRYAS